MEEAWPSYIENETSETNFLGNFLENSRGKKKYTKYEVSTSSHEDRALSLPEKYKNKFITCEHWKAIFIIPQTCFNFYYKIRQKVIKLFVITKFK